MTVGSCAHVVRPLHPEQLLEDLAVGIGTQPGMVGGHSGVYVAAWSEHEAVGTACPGPMRIELKFPAQAVVEALPLLPPLRVNRSSAELHTSSRAVVLPPNVERVSSRKSNKGRELRLTVLQVSPRLAVLEEAGRLLSHFAIAPERGDAKLVNLQRVWVLSQLE
eukprot:CAMPEP_0171240618 /NCGR_PEP_ID=MMETSP0790-20130122/44614_1 /TAXON_ID=2925 /ORGANISM="Alexandrium catenella, Strain OF101" /LENGTH=163 /DNA_ID=CAMNT_0011707085 /DNA_START=210 /DNA_END=699 /DNA_ORIENTATION=-